jgi:CheY-like chemotaxis protein
MTSEAEVPRQFLSSLSSILSGTEGTEEHKELREKFGRVVLANRRPTLMNLHAQPTPGVLVVDDDHAIREMLTEALEDAGYRVISAENGNQALTRLREAPTLPCVILLDLMMPVMSGWEFRVRQQADAQLAAIPVIALSARPSMQHESFTTTVDEFLQKPVDIAQLLTIVDRYCA